MAVNPKNEELFKNLTHGYSPSNYSVLKIRGHEHWLKRLVYVLLATIVVIILLIVYLQSVCLDTWYTKALYRWLPISNVCTDVSNKINVENKLSFNDGILTLSNGNSTTAVSIPYLIPGAPQGIIGKNGLPGQGGANGAVGPSGASRRGVDVGIRPSQRRRTADGTLRGPREGRNPGRGDHDKIRLADRRRDGPGHREQTVGDHYALHRRGLQPFDGRRRNVHGGGGNRRAGRAVNVSGKNSAKADDDVLQLLGGLEFTFFPLCKINLGGLYAKDDWAATAGLRFSFR